MATTVNNAFEEFMRDSVNLIPEKTSMARRSRDNLINNINGFSEEDDFFSIYSNKNLKYGSFARKTKIRELDDIDLMICLSAEGGFVHMLNIRIAYICLEVMQTEEMV